MAPSAFPLPGRTVRLPVALPPHRRREEAAGGAQEAEEVRDEPKRVVPLGRRRGTRREGRACRVRSPPLTLPQNTQNGLRPSRNTQMYWGCRGMEAGGLGVLCLLCAAKRLQCVQWRKKSRRFCNDLMIPIQLCAPLRVTVAILFRCHRIGLRTREHLPSSPTTSRARCAYRRGRSRSSHGRPRPFQRDRTPPQCPRPR